jgi:hypothetical protein
LDKVVPLLLRESGHSGIRVPGKKKKSSYQVLRWFIKWFIPGALFPGAIGSKGISKSALKTPVLEQRQGQKEKYPWQ